MYVFSSAVKYYSESTTKETVAEEFYHTFLTKHFPSFGVVFRELLNCLYERFVELTLYLQHQICNSPYCQPYNSKNGNSENLVFDQLIIPKLTFFFILITYLVDIVFIL